MVRQRRVSARGSHPKITQRSRQTSHQVPASSPLKLCQARLCCRCSGRLGHAPVHRLCWLLDTLGNLAPALHGQRPMHHFVLVHPFVHPQVPERRQGEAPEPCRPWFPRPVGLLAVGLLASTLGLLALGFHLRAGSISGILVRCTRKERPLQFRLLHPFAFTQRPLKCVVIIAVRSNRTLDNVALTRQRIREDAACRSSSPAALLTIPCRTASLWLSSSALRRSPRSWRSSSLRAVCSGACVLTLGSAATLTSRVNVPSAASSLMSPERARA